MSSMEPGVQFENFDDESVFSKHLAAACDFESQNFVLDFDGTKAESVFDLEKEDIASLLTKRKSQLASGEKLQTRWINIWKPESQRGIVKCLAHHYGFSPRLLSSMCCGPLKPVPTGSYGRQHRTMHEMLQRVQKREKKEAGSPEKGDVESIETIQTPTYNPRILDLNHYRIVDEVWHFASVDWGSKCS